MVSHHTSSCVINNNNYVPCLSVLTETRPPRRSSPGSPMVCRHCRLLHSLYAAVCNYRGDNVQTAARRPSKDEIIDCPVLRYRVKTTESGEVYEILIDIHQTIPDFNINRINSKSFNSGGTLPLFPDYSSLLRLCSYFAWLQLRV